MLVLNNRISKAYLTPTKIFVYIWGGQIVLCMIIFGNTVTWKYYGLIWLGISFFICAIISVVTGKKKSSSNMIEKNLLMMKEHTINSKLSNKILILFISLGLLYSILLIRRNGFSLGSLFNFNALLEMNNTIAVQRYSGNSTTGILNKLLLIFVYAAPMCGGYALVFAKDKFGKYLSIATMLPELLILFTENTKAPFVGCMIFFISSWLVGNMVRYGKIKKFNIRTIIIFIGVLIVSFALFTTTMMLRIGSWDSYSYSLVRNKMGNYVFGHIPAFDNWFSNNTWNYEYTFGAKTFIGIFDLLGLSSRSQGIYQDNYIGGALATNVYSYFRGIIDDFGMVGGLIFTALMLIIITAAYRKLENRQTNVTNQIILMVGYSFIMFFMVSLFSYNSFLFAFVLFAVYLFLVNGKKRFKLGI